MKRREFFGSGAVLLSAGGASLLGGAGRAQGAVRDPGAGRVLQFGSLADIAAGAGLEPGDLCACPKGVYRIVAGRAYAANGATVVDLAGFEGQAVLLASEPLADMQDMLGDTRPPAWFPDAAIVRTRAENHAFEVARQDETGAAVENSAGTRFRVIDSPLIDFDAFGGGIGRSGVENARALARAMHALRIRGGRVLFGSGTYVFAPAAYPATEACVWLMGAGMRATQFMPSAHGGKTRDWMMTFGEDGSVGHLGFEGIDIVAPASPERARFHGIRVCSTNQLIVRDCTARFVDGTAWQLERAHNSKIDVRTFMCGSSEDGFHSVLISGTLGDFAGYEDAVFNDSIIVGMTEQDHLGWKIENGLVIRPESSLKVHGGPEATRSLHLHRINNGAMSVYPTFGFRSDEFIMISDGGSSELQTIAVRTASVPTRFNLNVITNNNLRYFGGGTGALIAIDCASASSRVILSGDMLRNARREDAYRYVRLVAPGHPQAEIDLSDLKFQDDDAAKWVEDMRTASSKTISRRATGLHLPAVMGLVGSGAARKLVGQTDHIFTNGDPAEGAAPRMSLIGLADIDGPRGTLLYSAMQPLTASIAEAAGSRTVIASQRLNIPLHGKEAATAVLKRLTVGASGVPAAHDPAHFWRLRLYVAGAATDLVLCRDRTAAAPGDGLPSKVLEGWAPDSHGFDFHKGIGWLTVSRDQTFTIRLEPTGQPPALQDVTVTAYCEMRN